MRVGKLEAKQEIMYVGGLKIARTKKWGKYVKNKRYDVDRLIAEELLKIPGFIIPYFLARFKGPEQVRKIRVLDRIYECPKGIWVKLPIGIDYKINGDPHFQVGPEGKDSAASQILRQQTIDEDRKRKVSISRPKPKSKVNLPANPQIIRDIPKVEAKKEEVPVSKKIEDMDIPKRAVQLLKEAGIVDAGQITGIKVLLGIKGIGPSTARDIMRKL